MKYIISVAIVVAIVTFGYFATNKEKTIEFTSGNSTTTIQVDALNTAIEQAITASSTEIEASAQKAYEDAKAKMELDIELAVRTKYRKELEKKEQELMGKASF